MADKKISQLTAVTLPLAGTEVLPVVQSGSTKKATVADITDRLGLGTMATQDASNVAITGGTINGTTIGATTKATGQFTTVQSNIAVVYGETTANALQIEATASGSTLTATGYGSLRWTSGAYTPASIEAVRTSPGGGFGTDIVFRTHPNSGFDATDKVKITQDGNISILTSGKGIDFSADGQAAGMTSELLDDYEEGTWTPVFASAAGTITSTTVNGATYTKVGRLVTLGFDVTITDNGTGSIAINVTGLPFSIAAAYSSAGSLIEVAAVGFGGFVNPNSTTSLSLTKYDWTYPGGTNYRLVGSISYNV